MDVSRRHIERTFAAEHRSHHQASTTRAVLKLCAYEPFPSGTAQPTALSDSDTAFLKRYPFWPERRSGCSNSLQFIAFGSKYSSARLSNWATGSR